MDSKSDHDETLKPSTLPLSDDEKRVLELYDRLQQLQLEIALINAQNEYVPSSSPSQSVAEAQNSLLESSARYLLRNDVAESVIIANPVLQAVHGGTNASPIERDLLPVLVERDSTSAKLAEQSATLRRTLDKIQEVEVQSLQLSRENVELASQVRSLAEEAKRKQTQPIEDPQHAAEISRLEKELKASRQRWRVMKATASAVVAGSGLDWARDEELRSIVLDEDEDGV